MKKQALLLMAGGLLAFASCNTETTSTSTASDAQIDSTVNARVEEIRLDMMRQNDSMINALAQIKADSIIAAMKGGSASTTTHRSAPTKNTQKTNPAAVGGATATPRPGTQMGTTTNTGKVTGEQGTNTGKKGDQSEGTNTGKRK